jgi:hypothetical protein
MLNFTNAAMLKLKMSWVTKSLVEIEQAIIDFLVEMYHTTTLDFLSFFV